MTETLNSASIKAQRADLPEVHTNLCTLHKQISWLHCREFTDFSLNKNLLLSFMFHSRKKKKNILAQLISIISINHQKAVTEMFKDTKCRCYCDILPHGNK